MPGAELGFSEQFRVQVRRSGTSARFRVRFRVSGDLTLGMKKQELEA